MSIRAMMIGGAGLSPPGAPTGVSATGGALSASVTFSAPANNGGSAITSFTVTSSPSGLTETGSSSPITVSGLTNGTAYTFTVTATNAIGTSPASAASNSVTPTGAALSTQLISAGFTEVSSNVFRRNTAGTLSANFTGRSVQVHVIGAGGWSGQDGQGYGNCGGGGGGGGAVASFSSIGVCNMQIGAAIDPGPPAGYTSGQDGALSTAQVVSIATPGSTNMSWFISDSTLFGNGGHPGWYNAVSLDDAGQPSGRGGTAGGSAAGIVSSTGGQGGGSLFTPGGNNDGTALAPQSSTYGGGGGGIGNFGNGGFGASGALNGVGGRGGVPQGSGSTPRQNERGTLGSGNGAQAKFMVDNETPPFTVLSSSPGVIQITITS